MATRLVITSRKSEVNLGFLAAMETKCKTVPARRAGKSKNLPARGQTCLPDLADKRWCKFKIYKFYINISQGLRTP